MFAKVVFGLPVEGPFDYSVPETMRDCLKPGSRVRVDFRGKREIGYVVSTAGSADVPSVKPVVKLIDPWPVIGRNLLELSEDLSSYYCCSRGEAIETILPETLRAGRKLEIPLEPAFSAPDKVKEPASSSIELIHDPGGKARWEPISKRIGSTVASGRSCIFLVPDVSALQHSREMLWKAGIEVTVLPRGGHDELNAWRDCLKRPGKPRVIAGTRSAVFAPLSDLGLIIVTDEEDSLYKQDQFPHYHSREIARMRCRRENASLLLISSAPSLTAWHMAERGEAARKFFAPEAESAAHIIDTGTLPLLDRKLRIILSRQLQDLILRTLSANQKVLVFLNRTGFATYAFCPSCKTVFTCPRCSINLVYRFQKGELYCRYCNHAEKAPRLCPRCNSGYVRYSGAGTEKIESELARLFPQARLSLYKEGEDFSSSTILVASQTVLGKITVPFGLVCVLSIDRMLNHADHMATEKTYSLLVGLRQLASVAFAVQTGLPDHPMFSSLRKNDPSVFYSSEYASRKELDFPPFTHFAVIKLRGKDNDRVKKASEKLFAALGSASETYKKVNVIALNPGNPEKIRSNYYWNILLCAADPESFKGFLKLHLKGRRQSGIIVTIDVDPL